MAIGINKTHQRLLLALMAASLALVMMLGGTFAMSRVMVKTNEFVGYSETPVTPDKPTTPDKPVTPDTPAAPDKPVTPDKPAVPDKPVTPDKPATSENPSVTNKPIPPDTSTTPYKTTETITPDNRPPNGPKTGVSEDPTPWFAVMVTGAFLLRKVVISIERKR